MADTATLLWNTHLVKFGFDFTRTEDYTNLLFNRTGTYSFPSFTALAQDLTGNAAGNVYVADTANHRVLAWTDAAALSTGAPPDRVLLDGNHDYLRMGARVTTVIKGDATSLAVAAASCVAKVARDALMAGDGPALLAEADLQTVEVHHAGRFAPLSKSMILVARREP